MRRVQPRFVSARPERADPVIALHPVFAASAEAIRRACTNAAGFGRVALDTEADSFHSYRSKLCLIQLSFGSTHVVIDPLAVSPGDLAPLTALLADRDVTVIMHGADYDLRVLDRDLGVEVTGLRDTQAAAQLLGEEQTGLAALLEKYLGVSLDKKFQRADWGERPLKAELLGYAANDTAHLEALCSKLEGLLEGLGRLEWWREECAALETVRWEPPVRDELAFERIKGAARLQGESRDRLASLYNWREEIAAQRDVAPFRVVRNEVLLAVATAAPATQAELAQAPGVPAGIVRRWGKGILGALQGVRPVPPRLARPREAVDREREARIRSLRMVRDTKAKELGLAPGVLASRSLLEAVADERPGSPEELRALLQRRWRAEVLGPNILPMVSSWSPAGKLRNGPIS